MVTVLAPEVLLGKYWLDYKEAKEKLSALQRYAQEDGVEWTISHSLFANMGGFAMRINLTQRRPALFVLPKHENRAENGTDSGNDQPNESLDSEREASRSQVNHTTDEESGLGNLQRQKYTYLLSASSILELRSRGTISRMPDISKEELHDRSKADGLMRLITVVQIMWMCIQVITRAVRGLTVSQLEISVTAFASCAVAMYWLTWDKPKGVMVPVTILQLGNEARAIIGVIDQVLPPPIFADRGQSWWIWMRGYIGTSLARIIGDHVHIGFGVTLGGLLFGGVHLIAWNFAFPSETERLLWRITALYCACFPIGYLLLCSSVYTAWKIWCQLANGTLGSISAVARLTGFRYGGIRNFFYKLFLIEIIPKNKIFFFLVLVPGITLYILARIYLLVEMLRTLAYLPPDAYMGTWTVNIPYFG